MRALPPDRERAPTRVTLGLDGLAAPPAAGAAPDVGIEDHAATEHPRRMAETIQEAPRLLEQFETRVDELRHQVSVLCP